MDADILQQVALNASREPRFRSLLVARNGRIVLEEYFEEDFPQGELQDVRSVTKSIVSLVAGVAHAEGYIPNLDESIATYLGDRYTLDEEDARITVRHLLTMTSGYEWDDTTHFRAMVRQPDPVQFVLDRPQTGEPGTTWTYSSGDVYVLGAVLEGATGTPFPEFAATHLFKPAGIHKAEWETFSSSPPVNVAAGVQLAPRDLLRLGQLVLQRGRSGKRQIVPAEWIDISTSTLNETSANPRAWRYGLLWWTYGPNALAFGYGGQTVRINRDLNLVVVATTNWGFLSDDGFSGEYLTVDGERELASLVQNIVGSQVQAAVQ